ncbi:DUF2793 domain-containing protein [Sphingomonas sp. PB4P5]|uniref:DUF2793 domain-containing protein n=1 Tax=Parasphingomonas puruogangriensis TaxID=3096155 RepID=UPI002FC9B528
MSDTTARLGLPMIRPGQAQKELSHNEALAVIDLLIGAQASAFGLNTPPTAPAPGAAWVVGSAPLGAWAGKAGQVAGWTEGGWRFVAPVESLVVWIVEAAVIARFSGGAWVVGELTGSRVVIDGVRVVGARQPAVASPSGGTTVDTQARAALAALLTAVRAHGLIAP